MVRAITTVTKRLKIAFQILTSSWALHVLQVVLVGWEDNCCRNCDHSNIFLLHLHIGNEEQIRLQLFMKCSKHWHWQISQASLPAERLWKECSIMLWHKKSACLNWICDLSLSSKVVLPSERGDSPYQPHADKHYDSINYVCPHLEKNNNIAVFFRSRPQGRL